MNPHEWMVKYTPQTDWIKGSGAIVWLSFYAGLLGSGSYLASLYFNSLTGMLVGWLIVVALKNLLHVAHAKRPLALWRMILKPRTSWIARGTILCILFTVFGFIQLALAYLNPGTTAEMAFKALTGIMAFFIIIYEGFTLNYVTGIPFWNSALLPVSFISWGILSGLSLVTAIGLAGTDTKLAIAVSQEAIVVTVILTGLYLWNAVYAGATARESVRRITHGLIGVVFIIGAILLGLIVPIAILFNHDAIDLAKLFFVCEFVGGLAFTYSVFKAGIYSPLIPGDWR